MWDWARWCRRVLVATGVVALLMGGVLLFGQPDHEILYQADSPLTVCGAHGCTFIYRLEVGNSGAEPQDEVIVRLRRDAVQAAILPVKVRDFGKIDRRVRVWDEGDVRAYALGRLEPRVRVEVGSRGRTSSSTDLPVALKAARFRRPCAVLSPLLCRPFTD